MTKKIKLYDINPKTEYQVLLNQSDVTKIVDETNGRARAHTYNSYNVYTIALNAEKRLEKAGVPLKKRNGARVIALSGVPTSNAYARKAREAVASRVELLRGAKSWYLVSYEKTSRYAGSGGGESIRIEINNEARASIIARALEGFVYPDPLHGTL